MDFDFGIRNSVAAKIANYGTAVTVGVFIGAALTTGIAAGVGSWYLANKLAISAYASSLTTFLSDTSTTSKEKEEQAQHIDELQQRVLTLEHSFRLLNAVDGRDTAAGTAAASN